MNPFPKIASNTLNFFPMKCNFIERKMADIILERDKELTAIGKTGNIKRI